MKLGHSGNIFEEVFETGEQMSDWYNNGNGDEKAVEQLARFTKKIVKGKKTKMQLILSNIYFSQTLTSWMYLVGVV